MSFQKSMHGILIFRLEKGDNFKILYTSKFIDDSIYIGLNRVHNAYFEHREPFYAIEYETDSIRGITEYFDENGKNLESFSCLCSI